MNMKRFIACSMIVLFSVGAVKSQTESDPQAIKILKQVRSQYKSYKNFKAEFKLTLENLVDSINESQSGTVYLMGDKYNLDIGGQQIICDSKTIWTYLKEVEEVTVSTCDPDDEDLLNPQKIFDFYEEDQLCRLIEEKTINGKQLQIVDLTPTVNDKPYFRIRLWIDKNTHNIIKSKVSEKSGNRYTYEISEFSPDIDIDESLFSFDPSKHPDVEVIDLTE